MGIGCWILGGEVNWWLSILAAYAVIQQSLTQIAGTTAEPQQIVAQRLLSCLQYRVPYLSRLQRI